MEQAGTITLSCIPISSVPVPGIRTGFKKMKLRLHTYRFSHTGMPASFSLMYAGRFIQSSDSAGSFT